MISQSFDLFGTADAPVTVKTARTPHQAMLFAGELFAHVDPNRKPAEPVALDPALHDATIDDAPATDDRPEVIDVADLTDADIAHLVANSRVISDDEIAARLAEDDDICQITGMTRAERDAAPDITDDPAPAPARRPGPPVVAGTRRVAGAGGRDFRYVGLVRIAGGVRGTGPVITECGHEHANRDWSTGAAGGSARDCARQIIAGANNPATAEHTARRLRTAPAGLTNGAGFTMPAGTIEAARATAEANAASYLAAVAAVAAHLHPSTGEDTMPETTDIQR
jgi:hypothetical protein